MVGSSKLPVLNRPVANLSDLMRWSVTRDLKQLTFSTILIQRIEYLQKNPK